MQRLSAPLRVDLPWWRSDGETSLRLPVAPVSRAARALTVVVPTVLAVVGLVLALASAVLAERGPTEAVGTLGVELGAAMWFGGAVTLGARRGATVGRALALLGLAASGAVLIALALAFSWTGAALSLAMEFGVGAVAVAVIDVLLLGLVQARLVRLGDASDDAVTVTVNRSWPLLVVHRDGGA